MFKGLKRCVVLVLLLYLVVFTLMPAASAQVQIRREVKAGDFTYNKEIILFPLQRTLFHQDTLATTDTEALAIAPISSASAAGFTLAQTCDQTTVATSTGFFDVNFPFIRIEEYPGKTIGDGLNWVANQEPIRFAGLPKDTMMTFPGMTKITRIENPVVSEINDATAWSATGGLQGMQSQTGLGRNDMVTLLPDNTTVRQMMNGSGPDDKYSYRIDANASSPYYPGNMMLVKNITNAKGQNETVVERVPRDYMTFVATPEEVANKTILERMWRNVHLNFQMDRAYSGETAYPTWIYPIKEVLTLMPMVPDEVSISDSLNMTMPGKRMKEIFWPV